MTDESVPSPQALVARVRDLLAKATPGPWTLDERVGMSAVYLGERLNCLDFPDSTFIHVVHGEQDPVNHTWTVDATKAADAALIASAPADLAALCDAVERLGASNQSHREAAEHLVAFETAQLKQLLAEWQENYRLAEEQRVAQAAEIARLREAMQEAVARGNCTSEHHASFGQVECEAAGAATLCSFCTVRAALGGEKQG